MPDESRQRRGTLRGGRAEDPAEAVALVACAKREVLLRVHRYRLRREDLEDCYSQATLELVVLARSGRRFAGLYRAGLRSLPEIIAENPLAQDYVALGRARAWWWVTIYATDVPTPHVFLDDRGPAPRHQPRRHRHRPQPHEDGPRWRILPEIPTWARWSVRHPPGL